MSIREVIGGRLGDWHFVEDEPINWLSRIDQAALPRRAGTRGWRPSLEIEKQELKGKLQRLIDEDLVVFPYVFLNTPTETLYGLVLKRGGPEGDWIDHENMGSERRYEPTDDVWTPEGAIEEFDLGNMVKEPIDIETAEEYNAIMDAYRRGHEKNYPYKLEIPEWTQWKGPGIYDPREYPPTWIGTPEEYEQQVWKWWAFNMVTDLIYQGDKWYKPLVTLVRRQAS